MSINSPVLAEQVNEQEPLTQAEQNCCRNEVSNMSGADYEHALRMMDTAFQDENYADALIGTYLPDLTIDKNVGALALEDENLDQDIANMDSGAVGETLKGDLSEATALADASNIARIVKKNVDDTIGLADESSPPTAS